MTPVDAGAAKMIQEATSRIAQYPTPFFGDGAIYYVEFSGRHHPTMFQVGCAGAGFTALIANNAAAWYEFVRRAGLRLDNSRDRINYVRMYLEVVRPQNERLALIRSVTKSRRKPSQGRTSHWRRLHEIREKHRSTVQSPSITEQAPWQLKLFGIRRQDLVEFRAILSDDGKIDVGEVVLDAGLPINWMK